MKKKFSNDPKVTENGMDPRPPPLTREHVKKLTFLADAFAEVFFLKN